MVKIKIVRYTSSPFTLVAEATVLILAALGEERFFPTGDCKSLEASVEFGCQDGKMRLCEDTFRQVQKFSQEQKLGKP